ncbi:MAG: hypothetical protein GX224_04500 [Thermoplasmatales archaeon]|nr:hypothetical protein [Thermoplasmatales archaeon]
MTVLGNLSYEENGERKTRPMAVAVDHPEYGMSGHKARVVEAVYDLNDPTTTVRLNTASLAYGNAIGDARKAANAAGDIATDATACKNQYVYVKTETAQTILGSGNAMKIKYQKGAQTPTADSSSVTVVQVQPLGRAFIQGTFNTSTTDSTTDAHAVIEVQVNGGAWIQIPEPRRPDFYRGQTLTVGVNAPLP